MLNWGASYSGGQLAWGSAWAVDGGESGNHMAAVEPRDTFAATGVVRITGSMAAVEPKDTFSAEQSIVIIGGGGEFPVIITGVMSAVEPMDTFSATGVVRITGSMAAVEPKDTFSATGGGVTPLITRGIRVQLCDRLGVPRANVTGIIAIWWDDEGGDGPYALRTASASTDGDGWLTIDASAATSLDIDDRGLLALLKHGETPAEDWSLMFRAAIEDVTP